MLTAGLADKSGDGRLNALVSIAELARQMQFPGQRRRLSNHLGFTKGPELLARIVLLAVYTDEFQGRDADGLVQQLHQQVRFSRFCCNSALTAWRQRALSATSCPVAMRRA